MQMMSNNVEMSKMVMDSVLDMVPLAAISIKCLSPLNDWTDFLIQFRTLNLGNHEYKTSKLEC